MSSTYKETTTAEETMPSPFVPSTEAQHTVSTYNTPPPPYPIHPPLYTPTPNYGMMNVINTQPNMANGNYSIGPITVQPGLLPQPQQPPWMTSQGCPLELQSLCLFERLRIEQRFDMTEVLLNVNMNACFNIVNQNRELVFVAVEESNMIIRQSLGRGRPCVIRLKNSVGKEVLTINKQVKYCMGCASCLFPTGCNGRDTAATMTTVESPNHFSEKIIGEIKQTTGCCSYPFEIHDGITGTTLKVVGKICCSLCACHDHVFEIYNKSEKCAEITYVWQQHISNSMYSTSIFDLKFLAAPPGHIRYNCLAMAFVLHFTLYERNARMHHNNA